MTTPEFVAELRRLDVKVWADGDRLRCSAPKGALTSELREELAKRKPELMAFLQVADVAAHHGAPPLVPIPRDGPLPLSFVQERMWLSDQLVPDNSGANAPGAVRLTGPVDMAALQLSIDEIVRRHEILRTTFPCVEGRPVQAIAPPKPLPVPVVDLAIVPEPLRQAEVKRLTDEEARRPFDLARGPLFRITLLRLSERDHVMLVNMPHIVCDGWSLGVVVRELASLYHAFSTGHPSPLPELPIQYADFAAWQRRWLQSEDPESRLAYWKRQLGGHLPVLELPTDRPRPAGLTFRGATRRFTLPVELRKSLEAVSQRHGVTLFMTLLAAFKALLSRYTGQEDIVVGSPIAGRTRVETEGLIGCFMNPLVLRTDLSGDPGFVELLGRVREVCLGAYAHQDLPFEVLVKALRPKLDLTHMPLFQVLFNLQHVAPIPVMELPGLVLSPLEIDSQVSTFDMTVDMRVAKDDIVGVIEYRVDLFDAATITGMLEDYRTVLERVIADPDRRLSSLAVLRGAVADDDIARRVSELSPEKRALLETLLREEGEEAARAAIPTRRSEASPPPLSFGQQRLWVFDQLEPGNPVYNVPGALHLTGPLDVAALGGALDEIVRRHDGLRTTFTSVEGRPVQVIAPTSSVTLAVVDLAGFGEEERQAEARRLATEEAQGPFDLSRGPLLRVTLLRLAAEEHTLLMTVHHIVCDGWSIVVLVRELAVLYEAFTAGRASPLPELAIQYPDFAVWQRQWLQGNVLESQLGYWRQRLGGRLPVLELPADRSRPAVMAPRGALRSFALPAPLSESLKELSRREGVTLFMTLLAAFKVLLFRYTGQDDILVDSSIAGRSRAETQELIGFFVNELVLRTDLSGEPSFRELLGRVREVCLGAYEHQDLPFEKLVRELQPERDLSRAPLVQVSFNVLEPLGRPVELAGGLTLKPTELETGRAKFDVTLQIWEDVAGLAGSLEYSTELFDSARITRMLEHYQTVLESVAADPEQRIADVLVMPSRERQQVLVEWNETRTEDPPGQCLQQLFEAQVERTPAAVAVACPAELEDGARLTYRELNRRANQLARRLQRAGVGPEVRVGLCVERSLGMAVAVLGILKAGGAYVPLDPSYPHERLSFMLADAQVAVLVTHEPTRPQGQGWLAAVDGEPGLRVVDLDADAEEIAGESAEDPVGATTAENAAYVIYTSGSTGRPKGVVITHRGVVNHNLAVAGSFGLGAEDRVLQFHSLSFDAAVEELFPTWLSGGTVVLRPWDVPGPGPELHGLIEREQLTVLNLPTAYWHAWVDEMTQSAVPMPASLRAVVVGGEKATAERVRTWRHRVGARVRWLNTYGPTEATVIATLHELGAEDEGEVPIGRPIANTQVYVLDRRLHPVPIGVPGELHIGGRGVARGYLNRPELTAEKFIPDPVGGAAGGRLYKTGDLARYRADGALEFLGRVDEQVKIRGFRIEPGEIEAVLAGHPGVRAAVVVAREDTPSETRLVAYIVADQQAPPTSSALRNYLREELPAYMVPSVFVTLDAIPLTSGGKLNRRALPAPGTNRPEVEEAFMEPQTAAEKVLAEIWAEVLGVERVGVHDNFFELGGDSILGIQIIAKATRAGLRLTPKQIFQHQTIAELISVAGTALMIETEQGLVTGPVPLTPIQAWFFEQQFSEPHHFNQALLLDLRQALEPARLERVVEHLLSHHDALRLRFVQEPAGWQSVNAGGELAPVSRVDLSGLAEGEQGRAIEATAAALQASLDLSAGPLLRVALFDCGPQKPGRLLIVIHHLVVDGVSWRILLEDLSTAYQQLGEGEAVQLPAKTMSFKQWAERLTEHARSGALQEELGYWLGSDGAGVELPVDDPGGRSANTVASARTVSVVLSVEETQALLHEVLEASHAQINDVLLTALGQAFAGWTGGRQLLVDLEGHGREEIVEGVDLSRTVSWFTTIFPVRLEVGPAADPGEALKAMKEQLRGIPNRGIGYGVLRYLSGDAGIAERLRALPHAEVGFNYLGQVDQIFGEASPFVLAEESPGPLQSPQGARSHVVDVNGMVVGGRLRVEWTYSENIHQRQTIEGLAERFVAALRGIIEHSQSSEAADYTPEDFPDVELSQAQLEKVLAEIERGGGAR